MCRQQEELFESIKRVIFLNILLLYDVGKNCMKRTRLARAVHMESLDSYIAFRNTKPLGLFFFSKMRSDRVTEKDNVAIDCDIPKVKICTHKHVPLLASETRERLLSSTLVLLLLLFRCNRFVHFFFL